MQFWNFLLVYVSHEIRSNCSVVNLGLAEIFLHEESVLWLVGPAQLESFHHLELLQPVRRGATTSSNPINKVIQKNKNLTTTLKDGSLGSVKLWILISFKL